MKLNFFGIDNLNFVEFNTTGSNTEYQKLSPESRFLSSEVFNLFALCFEKSDDLYEYFGPSKFNARNIVILQNELKTHLGKLEQINTCDFFVKFINNTFLGQGYLNQIQRKNVDWTDDWQLYLSKIIEVNKTIIQIIDKCIDDERTLWVIGY